MNGLLNGLRAVREAWRWRRERKRHKAMMRGWLIVDSLADAEIERQGARCAWCGVLLAASENWNAGDSGPECDDCRRWPN